MIMKKYCEYIRVSTKRQGYSGLGLAAQQEINRDYIKSVNGEIVETYQDIESGTHRDRPGLWKAIEYCKENKTTLLVAKLDRLARDVEFTFKIINTGIDIHFVDMPAVNTIILGVFASVAQYERELISKRTTDALRQRKRQIEQDGYFISKAGNKCTSLGGTTTGQAKGGKVNGEKRRKEAMGNSTNRIVGELLKDCVTPQDIDRVAEKLNAMGLKTHSGLEFTRNRLTALRTKINRRTEYAQICAG
jgi:DNA invertase Pin-like site-specific DNA recombinase